MTTNQIAMKNIARGSVRAQIGNMQLKPACYKRLMKGALKHWQDLDAARTARNRKSIVDRDRKKTDQEARKDAMLTVRISWPSTSTWPSVTS